MDEVWVDFAWTQQELGTQSNPYNTLGEGITWLDPSGVKRWIHIKGGSTSNETPRITAQMRLIAENGTVRIGVSLEAKRLAPGEMESESLLDKFLTFLQWPAGTND